MTDATTTPSRPPGTWHERAQSFRLIRRLLADQGRKHWNSYCIAGVCMGVMALATALSAWIMKDIVNKIFINKDLGAVWLIGGSIAVLYIAKGFAGYVEQVVLARIANNIVADFQTRIYDHMLAINVDFYTSRHSTDFIARQAFICQAASRALNTLITAFGRDLLTVVGLAAVMILQDPVITAVGMLIVPGAVIGIRKLGGRVRQVMLNEFSGFAAILVSLQETAQGIRVVKAFSLEPVMRARQAAAIASFERAANKLSMVGARTSPLMETISGLVIAVVVIYGGLSVIVSGRDAGNFFAFITALLLVYEPAKRIARLHIDLTSSLVGVGMLYEFLDIPSREQDSSGLPDLKVKDGAIEFKNIHFSYRPNEPVLRGLDLKAAAGQTTALVGRSGGGKTTITALLLRFYEPGSGVICIDGQDINSVSTLSLRRQIAYVSQDTFLFEGTVRDNIAMGRPGASFDDIVEAARAAHAHEFISGFEHGYDSACGEHGMQLSGGQRQRIAIARAFLKNAPIIVLDEATSALDSESERIVQDALARLCAGRTTIIIAHRLSTIINADMICVIEDGVVQEAGTHKELVARQELYFRLHQTNELVD